jgi:hypothetical protein
MGIGKETMPGLFNSESEHRQAVDSKLEPALKDYKELLTSVGVPEVDVVESVQKAQEYRRVGLRRTDEFAALVSGIINLAATGQE